MIQFNCPNCDRLYELPAALAKITLVCKQCGTPFVVPEGSTVPPPPPPPPKVVAPPFSPIPVPLPQPTASQEKAAKPQTNPVAPKPVVPVAVSKPTPAAEPKPPSPPEEEPSEEDVLVTRPDSSPDIDFNTGGPTAQSLNEANRPRPAGLSSADHVLPAAKQEQTDADDEPEINLDLLPKASAPPPPPWRPLKVPQAPEPEPTDETPAAGVLPFLADLLVLILLVAVGIFLGQFLVNKPIGELLATPKFPSVDLLLLIAPAIVFVLIYLLLNKREKTLGGWLRKRRQQAL